jgi:hypothetical protein
MMQGGTKSMSNRNPRYVSEVQHAYAGILQAFVIVGFVLLFLSFVLFATGVLPNVVSVSEVPQHWDKTAEEYAEATGVPAGWSWVGMLWHGDILTFAALVFIASGTLVCFIGAAVLYLREHDYAYTAMVIAQVIVLALAASGVTTLH